MLNSFYSYDRHPAAELFPMVREDELEKLASDIAANGLREPVVLYEGQILDGRNRLRACELAGIEPRFEEWDGQGSPLAFVLSRNLHRRHLDESQRAVIAARAKEMFTAEAAARERARRFGSPEGNPAKGVEPTRNRRVLLGGANLRRPERSNSQAAKLVNVSPRSVAMASRLLASGHEQVIAAVEGGGISVSDAAAIVKLPKPRQRELLELVQSGKARTLRAAAKVRKPKSLPAAVLRSNPREPQVMRGKVRRAYRYFMADYEAFRGYIEMAADGCGGANSFTERAREGLAAAQAAMHDCLTHYGRAKGA